MGLFIPSPSRLSPCHLPRGGRQFRFELVSFLWAETMPGDEQAPACTEFARGWSVIVFALTRPVTLPRRFSSPLRQAPACTGFARGWSITGSPLGKPGDATATLAPPTGEARMRSIPST